MGIPDACAVRAGKIKPWRSPDHGICDTRYEGEGKVSLIVTLQGGRISMAVALTLHGSSFDIEC